MKTGAELITDERTRQISKEGWTPEHDDGHNEGEMTEAAICYAQASQFVGRSISMGLIQDTPERWPWDHEWWKPSQDRVRNLVKAGALIAAEIDRITRAGDVNSASRKRAEGAEP